jgi:hypothetical protein
MLYICSSGKMVAVEEWEKITKRRGLKKQQELWLQQMAGMKETGVTFRPELADK